MKLEGQLWFAHEGQNLAGQGRIELLQQIADTGSISKAAKAAGMSYKTAWDAVDAMNKATGSPLVERSVGGKGGGGTRLTAKGEELVAAAETDAAGQLGQSDDEGRPHKHAEVDRGRDEH